MRISCLDYLVCPQSREKLRLESKVQTGNRIDSAQLYAEKSGGIYEIKNGIAVAMYPEELAASDDEFKKKYDLHADFYDEGIRWLFNSFFENESKIRTQLVDFLDLQGNEFVLNMGGGTCSDSFFLAERLSNGGRLVNFDLSRPMLEVGEKRLAEIEAKYPEMMEYVVGNASYLPFADHTFDAIFHFGGINTFSEKQKAFDEMARVVKPGGKIVVGDESASPWLRDREFGKIIRNANPLYNHTPPLEMLPQAAENVSLHYLLGNSFYVIVYTVNQGPKLNMDLPIPGKRGGTLRSRYEGRPR